jgi:NADPH:quinone reductase-like Zn-dependent oxidoreductase
MARQGTMMAMMKAAVCTRYGPPEVLQLTERERPVPADDEVLIRVRAASVTNSDIFIRSSHVELRVLVPFRLMMGITKPRREIGGEVIAGEIVQTGAQVKRLRVGDQVYGLTGFKLGAYAEYACLKDAVSTRGGLAIKPKNISYEEATSVAYGGLLALQFLEQGNVLPGQQVLIYGAAGTSGTIAVQYAKHRGAIVTGVCSASKADLVRSLGAAATIDYHDDDAVSRLARYDLVLDAVGKARTSALREALRLQTPKKNFLSIDDAALQISLERLDRIRDLVEAGVITPVTDRIYPLEEIVQAHRYVEQGHKTGNVAITIPGVSAS